MFETFMSLIKTENILNIYRHQRNLFYLSLRLWYGLSETEFKLASLILTKWLLLVQLPPQYIRSIFWSVPHYLTQERHVVQTKNRILNSCYTWTEFFNDEIWDVIWNRHINFLSLRAYFTAWTFDTTTVSTTAHFLFAIRTDPCFTWILCGDLNDNC